MPSQICIPLSPTVRDAFPSELFKLSPPHLRILNLKGCSNLHKAELSPLGSCPSLEELDLSGCPSLEYVLLQSHSLATVNLSNCGALTKVRTMLCRG